jgi:hypothetical protein
MITNKDKFVENKEISFILKQLETAIEKGDYFSTAVLITRLRSFGLKMEENTSHEEQSVVQ